METPRAIVDVYIYGIMMVIFMFIVSDSFQCPKLIYLQVINVHLHITK